MGTADKMTIKVCRFFNAGYCKYKSNCKFFHSPVSSDMDLKEEVAVLRSMEEELQKEYKHQKVKAETLQKDLENVKEKLEPKAYKSKSPKKVENVVKVKETTDVESDVDKETVNKNDKDQAEKVVMTDKAEEKKCRKCGKDFGSKKEPGGHLRSHHAEYVNDILEEKAQKKSMAVSAGRSKELWQ